MTVAEGFADDLAPAARPARDFHPVPETPASILYTSGTTGRPKGCVLSHGYEVASGAWYAALGGVAGLRPGQDRIYNPLPLYHANAGVVSLMGAILTGNADRPIAHAQHWWREVAETGATIVHYLGVIAPVLLKLPASTRGDTRSASASAPASSPSCMRVRAALPFPWSSCGA